MLLHHGLRVATARGTTVLVRELVVLVRRAIMWLVRLRIGYTHRSHCGN